MDSSGVDQTEYFYSQILEIFLCKQMLKGVFFVKTHYKFDINTVKV